MDAGMLLVGRYRLDRPVGIGGMGQVWAAHDTLLGRDVAIKAHKVDPDGDRAAFHRFRREARSAAALQHPNVVTIFDSGTEDGTAFLVMELLSGPTLEAHLADRGPFEEGEAVALAAQIASGLDAAHGAGVVHRDLKPANLMFDARGGLKIVDFGIARLAQTAAARLTTTNTVMGSAPYLSPEQIEGSPGDERSDVYALGCVMTTMLTGRPPFEGEHPLAVVNQHVTAAPPPISQRRPGIDPALEALVGQMLSKSPQDRPPSALHVLDRLRNIEIGSSSDSLAAGAKTTAVMGQPTRPLPVPAIHVTTPAKRYLQPSGRPSWVAGGLAVLALVAVVLIAIATMAGDPPANEAASSGGAATSAVPTREPASRTSSPPQTTKTAPTTTVSPQQAMSDLRSAVAAVSSSGQIQGKKAEELDKRVDELAKHVSDKGREDARKHVEEVAKYLRELSEKGELTPAGERSLAAALHAVRKLVVTD